MFVIVGLGLVETKLFGPVTVYVVPPIVEKVVVAPWHIGALTDNDAEGEETVTARVVVMYPVHPLDMDAVIIPEVALQVVLIIFVVEVPVQPFGIDHV